MTHEQQAILDLCDRVCVIEARLGLRGRHGTSTLPELTHRTWLAEVALDRAERRAPATTAEFRSRRHPQFRSRRGLSCSG